MRLALLLAMLLLAGCAAPDTSQSPAPEATPPGGEEVATEPGAQPIQQASVSWQVPASLLCVQGMYLDRVDGVTHGLLEVDEATWGLRYEAVFEASDQTLGYDVGFYDADLREISSDVQLTINGLDEPWRIQGNVPQGAAIVLFNTCGGGTHVDYQAGHLPA